MRTIRLFFTVLLTACFASVFAQEPGSLPVFDGYLTAAPEATHLMIDGRRVLTPKGVGSYCGTAVGGLTFHHGMPDFPAGTKLAVYGSWHKKDAAYVADYVCLVSRPEAMVSGSAVIDEVTHTSDGTLILADGRLLRIPGEGGPLRWQSPLSATTPLAAGLWIDYTASRLGDGDFLLKSGTLRDASFGSARTQNWQPMEFVAPSPASPGKLKLSPLTATLKLPYDETILARLSRVGGSVVPAWERSLPDGAPDKHAFHFYLTDWHRMPDCIAFPNGTILVPKKTEAELRNDAQLAGLLAGCVAEVLELQAVRNESKQAVTSGAEWASLAMPFGIGLVPLVGGTAYQAHLQEVAESQAARVALTYLQQAHYNPMSAALAWEVLNGKNGAPAPNKQPGTRATYYYRALATDAYSNRSASAAVRPGSQG